ncbi:hypothetical protein DCF79_07970 [Edwardsiella tarda]|uniref:hypothetical protein n=1 Tax=Edwardsiella tarda TaxID=636 RepID=UPI000D50F110|nr:hypothetical protein [Edwardsiella tarda]UCQ19338.1 hypothetical protein DCF79_07970 [Edwardsiella tarda]
MSEQVAVVYIGPKAVKHDTVTGSRMIFPRHQPVTVAASLAYQLLAFPSVFIPAERLQAFLAAEQAEQQQEQQLRERDAQLAQQRREAEQQSFMLEVEGERIDISKYTVAQLNTFVEAQALMIQKGAQEKADDFRARVRDAYREKQQCVSADESD